jgi:isoleucyl-tRNA synthetase
MDRVREVCSAALALREEKRIRVRLPLAELVVAAEWADSIVPYRELIESEVNVKRVVSTEATSEFASFRISVNPRKAGPRLGAKLKPLLAALKSPTERIIDNGGEIGVPTTEGTIWLLSGEWEGAIVPTPSVETRGQAVAALPDRKSVIALDVRITADLEREGLARDLVRAIQQARKDARLHISDRIRLRISGDAALAEAVRAHCEYISVQTLSDGIEIAPPEKGMFVSEGEVGEAKATIALARADG